MASKNFDQEKILLGKNSIIEFSDKLLIGSIKDKTIREYQYGNVYGKSSN